MVDLSTDKDFNLILNALAKILRLIKRLFQKSRNFILFFKLQDGVISGWFTQTLDHFDEGNPSTFKQRYFINNKYAKPESRRAFLHIGGEGPLSAGSIETDGEIVMHEIMMNAKIYGATVFALEHRYYGESLPDPKEG